MFGRDVAFLVERDPATEVAVFTSDGVECLLHFNHAEMAHVSPSAIVVWDVVSRRLVCMRKFQVEMTDAFAAPPRLRNADLLFSRLEVDVGCNDSWEKWSSLQPTIIHDESAFLLATRRWSRSRIAESRIPHPTQQERKIWG